MISKSSVDPEEKSDAEAGGWQICPECGKTYDTPRTYCQNCHYYSPELKKPPVASNRPARRKRLFLFFKFALLGLFLGYLAWVCWDYIPNPVLLLKEPSSKLDSRPQAGEWTNFGHDAARGRYMANAKPAVGRIAWSIDLGPLTPSVPAIKGGTLYVGGQFKILAINSETGQKVWEIATSGPVRSSPGIAGELVYFGLLNGQVIALDRFTGKQIWEYKTGNYVFGSPVVVDGILYIGSGDSMVYALDAATGEFIWKFKTNGLINFSPVVAEGILHIPTLNKRLYGLDTKTGAFRFGFRSYWSYIDGPVVGNGYVYFVSTRGRLYAIKHGARVYPGQFVMLWIWAQAWAWGFPVVPSQPGIDWHVLPENRGNRFSSSPAVTPGYLYLGDTSGWFYACDSTNGKTVWGFEADGSISSPPLVLGDTVYFGSDRGNLFALNRHTGKLNWKLPLDSPIISGPVYGAGRVFVRTKDGRLLAID